MLAATSFWVELASPPVVALEQQFARPKVAAYYLAAFAVLGMGYCTTVRPDRIVEEEGIADRVPDIRIVVRDKKA
jgi:hypothetical protein